MREEKSRGTLIPHQLYHFHSNSKYEGKERNGKFLKVLPLPLHPLSSGIQTK